MFTIIGADLKQYGPVSADEVRVWVKEGRADGRTLAKAEGETEWKPLSAIPEFAAFTAATGLPPRLPSAAIPSAGAAPEFADEPRDFDVGACLGLGWTLWTQNVGLLATATFLIWAAHCLILFTPVAGILIFLTGVLYGGLYLVYLKRLRGREAGVGGAFAGFGPMSVQLLLTGFLTSLLGTVAYCACILPGIYFQIAWMFALALVIDKRLEFWTAMELSRKVATRVWFKLFILTVVAFAPYILFQGFVNIKIMDMMYTQTYALTGTDIADFVKKLQIMSEIVRSSQALQLQFAAQVVLLLNLPFAIASQMQAYEALFGTRPAPTP